MKGKVMLLFCLGLLISSLAVAQPVSITGKVTDAYQNSLPGVNIYEKGTTAGTVTDLNGNYSITVSSGDAVLVFSFIGYLTEEETVGSRNNIDLVLIESIEALDEVVVVGYGTQRRSDITGSITSVDERSLREVPVSNISQALQGRASGVEITRTSTRPGSQPQIRIRGNRSLSADNDPLLVVDGIPFSGNLSDLNVDDISSIDVLKDASATAIYGSRGSNGVIIISTKRGSIGKPQFTYNGYYGISTVARKYEVFNGEEFARLRDVSEYPGWTPTEVESHQLGRETDWQDLMYRDGFTTNHELGASGGTEDTQYSLSGGYFEETTVLPGQAYSRYSLRATIDQKIGNRVKLGLTTLNSYSLRDGEDVQAMYSIVTMSPLTMPYDENGERVVQPASPNEDAYNPLMLNDDNWEQRRRRFRSFNTLYGELRILENLRYRINVGLDFNQDKFATFYGSETVFQRGGNSSARVDNREEFKYTIDNLLYYDLEFLDKHRINFTGLFSVEEFEMSSNRMDASEILADYILHYNFALAQTISRVEGNYEKWALLSYMGRLNYNYDDRYLLTVTARADGSSRLAKGNKWHYYPAFALGWNMHNESFLNDVTFLTSLKLRVGYGQVSNTSLEPYQTIGRLSNRVPYSFGPDGVWGFYVNELPNFKLGWEFTTTKNAGIDFGFLRNRITGSFDIYEQNTVDLLMEKDLPPTTGIEGSFWDNVGETRNRGMEFSINSVNISKHNGFNWATTFNLFLNREEIIALDEPDKLRDVGNGWFVGYPTNVIYDYNKIGIWQLDEAELAASYGREPGQIRVEDVNEDGSITGDGDRMVVGVYEPDFQFGLTNRFDFRGFDLSIVAFAKVGGTLVSQIHQPSSYMSMFQGRRNQIKVDYWTEETPDAEYPKPDFRYDNPLQGTTLGYFDATFVKIRSINFGYQLPQRWIGNLGLSQLRAYLTVTDPFVMFSPYMKAGGIDPEPTGERGTFQSGDEVQPRAHVITGNTPPTRSFIFGLNLRF